jgi:hypothetical protein
MQADKTKNHFHIDIKYIDQIPNGLNQGQFVYVDTTGEYKLAISSTDKSKSNVQGVVWSLLESGFFIKTSFGPLKYREPFGPEYYNKDENGNAIELEPISSLIPGDLGDRLWLSSVIPGGMQTQESNILLGYKTNFGMIYRPEFVWCINPANI